MMDIAGLLQIRGVYFVIHESLNEYSIDSSTPFEHFVPYNVIDPEYFDDKWYFECINSEFDYTLNLDIDKVTGTRRFWINHKVKKDGNIVGVFCSALQFDDIFYELFGHYDDINMLGFIIDHNGLIQMDSSAFEPELLRSGISIYDIEEKRHILEISPDPAFITAITAYLERFDAYLKQRTEPEVTRLSSGQHRFLSIAPILNTNWAIVTLHNTQFLFNITRFLPLAFVILLSFVMYVTISSTLVRKLVLSPLNLLTRSVSKASLGSNGIYGVSRNDEIGELAQAMQ